MTIYDWQRSLALQGKLDQLRPLQDKINSYGYIQEQVDLYKAAQRQADLNRAVQEQVDMHKFVGEAMSKIVEGAGLSSLIHDHASAYRPVQERIDAYKSVQETFELASGITARSYLEDISQAIERGQQLYQYRNMEETRLALERSISPFPPFQLEKFAKTYSYEGAELSNALKNINFAIAGAVYGGDVEVGVEEEEQEGDEERQPEFFEEQLVKVVSAGALAQLKRVDFVPINMLDRMLRSPEAMRRTLSARDFEHFVATLVEQLGFENVIVTPRSGDHGRDVLATKRVNDIPILFAFECKRYKPDHPVGPELLRALLGTITHGSTKANKGVLVTTSTFTSGARKYLFTEPALDGKDFDGIVGWLRDYAKQSQGSNN